MDKKILISASILGLIAIILGAFAAHALKHSIDANGLDSFKTGVRYQMYHAFLLLFVGSYSHLKKQAKKTLYYLILVGVVMFSGSIYFLSLSQLMPFNVKAIAFVTPVGGLFLIVAWLLLALNFMKLKQ